MPRIIDPDECIMCGVCEEVCPDEAISEADDTFVIDPEKCTDCGTCEPECPVDAISEAE
jgi:NAD-dependent dihydropyrimidine dehydrogenase PreA subunit